MDGLWRSAFAKGGQAWPAITLSYERFCERLKQLGHTPDTLPEYVEAVYACAASELGHAEACRAIEERHFGAVRLAVARVDGRKDFVDEVMQLLRVRLFSGQNRKIGTYTGRGPLERWLRTVALRLAFRQTKANGKLPAHLAEGSTSDTVPTVLSAPAEARDEAHAFKSTYARAFEKALKEGFRELAARERAVLRLHFAEAMTIDDIGRIYGVHRATAARWIASCREELAHATRVRLEAQLGQLPQDEFDSLFRLVHDELDLSVTSLLRGSQSLRRSAPSSEPPSTGRST